MDSTAVIGETRRGRRSRRAAETTGGDVEDGVEERGNEASGRSTAVKRSTLTDAQKYEICLFLKETDDGGEEKLTHRAVTDYILHRYNVKVDTSTISRLRKSADKRLSHESPNPFSKRHRAVTFPELERRLTHYIESNRGETRITDSMIVGKGKELRDELAIAPELLSFSAGWLSKFKIRNGLKIRLSDAPQPQQTLLPYQQQQQQQHQHQHSFENVDNDDSEEPTTALSSPPRPMVISRGSSPGSTRPRRKPTPISGGSTAPTEQGTPSKKRIRARRGVDKDAITISPRPSPPMASPLLHSPSPPTPSSPVLDMVGSSTMDQYGSQSDISDMDMDMEGPGIEDDADESLPTDHLQPTLPTLDYSNNSCSNDIEGESSSVSVSGSLLNASGRRPRSSSRAAIPRSTTNNNNHSNNNSSNPSPSNVTRRGQQGRPQVILSQFARIAAELSIPPAAILDACIKTQLPLASNTTPPLPYTIPQGSARRELAFRPVAAAAAAEAAPMTPFAGQCMASTPPLYIPMPFTVPTIASTDTSATKTATPTDVHSTTTLPFATTATTTTTTSISVLTSATATDRSRNPAQRVNEEDNEDEDEEEEEPMVGFKEAASCISTLRIFMEQQAFETDQIHHLQQIYLTLKRKQQSSKPSGS